MHFTMETARLRLRRLNRGTLGFTMVELAITMTIMVLVAGLAIPRIDTGRYRADAVAHSVRSAVQKAQRIAVQRQHDIIVGFDQPNARVGVFEDRNSNGVIDPGERLLWEPLGEGVFATPPEGVSGPVSGPVNGAGLVEMNGMQIVKFHRNGSTTTAAEIYLSSGRPALKDLRAITITRSTGRSQTFRYLQGRWIKEGA